MNIYVRRVYTSLQWFYLTVLSLFLLSVFGNSFLQAQSVASDSIENTNRQLETLRPEDYGKWEQMGSGVLSPYGEWLVYSIRRVNKENELRIHNIETSSVTVIPYGSGTVFSDDGIDWSEQEAISIFERLLEWWDADKEYLRGYYLDKTAQAVKIIQQV